MNTTTKINYGHEGQNCEFKTSFVISAGNHGEDQRFVVFKAACAMMNAEGGDIYIGVKDNGEVAIGPHFGIRGDIEKMPKICTNDAYARHINAQIDKYFDDARYVRGIMFAEEDKDSEHVIRIHVKKADRVVYMHKLGSDERITFRREGASSHEMNKAMIAQRERVLSEEKAKYSTDGKRETIRLRIQEAIERKQKIVIYGYSSSHSDSKTNRIVEPIGFICNGRSIWAYEEAKEGRDPLRQFRLGRIENVEVLPEACNHEESYKPACVDVFEWARPIKPAIHITIMIGPSAKNRLVEECPSAVEHLTEQRDGQWLLMADVHEIAPVKRFCQEFKDSITVYAPEELKSALGLIEQVEDKQESKTTEDTDAKEKNLMERIKLAFAILMPKMSKKLSFSYAGNN